MAKQPRGLFFFWDTYGLPLEWCVDYLRKRDNLTDKAVAGLFMWFVVDAIHAGWKDDKIKGDLREADRIGHLGLDRWFTKLYVGL